MFWASASVCTNTVQAFESHYMSIVNCFEYFLQQMLCSGGHEAEQDVSGLQCSWASLTDCGRRTHSLM